MMYYSSRAKQIEKERFIKKNLDKLTAGLTAFVGVVFMVCLLAENL